MGRFRFVVEPRVVVVDVRAQLMRVGPVYLAMGAQVVPVYASHAPCLSKWASQRSFFQSSGESARWLSGIGVSIGAGL